MLMLQGVVLAVFNLGSTPPAPRRLCVQYRLHEPLTMRHRMHRRSRLLPQKPVTVMLVLQCVVFAVFNLGSTPPAPRRLCVQYRLHEPLTMRHRLHRRSRLL
ncbi:hypothetical protein J6590_056010 [Homalodisca vitripennis]|nr:hypothetical protein J6590_056010 [Homalodisca vitripennis]